MGPGFLDAEGVARSPGENSGRAVEGGRTRRWVSVGERNGSRRSGFVRVRREDPVEDGGVGG